MTKDVLYSLLVTKQHSDEKFFNYSQVLRYQAILMVAFCEHVPRKTSTHFQTFPLLSTGSINVGMHSAFDQIS